LVLGSVSVAGTNGLTPMQLLWINLLTDVLPAIALAAEPTETDEMQRPPRNAKDSLIGNRRLKHYASEASLIAGGALTAHFYGLARYGSGARANALAFNSLLLGQLLHALSCRSDSHGVFAERKSEANRGLQLAIGGSMGLQLLANVLPWLRKLLGTGGMSLADIGVAAAGAVIPTMLIDAKKIRAARPAA
jgi:Ca2+-transporting ATPase